MGEFFAENGREYVNGNGDGAMYTMYTERESLFPRTMPIAIIGMSCRFPGDATDPEKLWDFCVNARSAWSEIPKTRFNQEAWYHPSKDNPGTSFVKGAHFLKEDIELFDASFFNFSSEVASTMDPQVRMQLESVFEAFENAGIPIEDIAGTNTSVFAGTCFRDNTDSHMRDPTTMARFFLTGNGMAMSSNRISHFFDLRGPSMSVDTGCSTTLTLLHLACQSLKAGDSKISVVGGANALLNPDMFISGTALGLLSPEGKCFAFDSRASGYGRGEGAATIILKPLVDAVRDGDPIRAVIRETAANQDGRTPTITSPSREAQEELVRACYRKAGLDPSRTGYAEAHGTGTIVGDFTEAGALGTVLGIGRSKKNPLLLGSVKTNIGHTEAASGLAGVIKVVLALEKGRIPPSINLDKPNSTIPFDELNIKIPRQVERWPSESLRRASVNNFGYGGANAHAIIEDPTYLIPSNKHLTTNGFHSFEERRSRIFTLSAKDEVAGRAMAANLRKYLSEMGESRDSEKLLDQLAYTLGQRRSHFSWNAAVPAKNVAELIAALGPEEIKFKRTLREPRLGFVFTGQGAQWYAMGRELIDLYPVFREALTEADKALHELGATWSLIDELMRDEHDSRVNEIIISLPICVGLQIALVRLLQSWGIKPTGVTGHSSGEVGAAYIAGAIDIKSAMAIVYTRGSLTTRFQEIMDRRGGMVAVGLGRDDANAYISCLTTGQVVVACVNSPSSVTISGDLAAILELEAILGKEKIFARKLKVDAGYHSHHMQPIADDYHKLLSRALKEEPRFGDIIFSSPTTGKRIDSAAVISSPEHWVKNMVQPVEFFDSLASLCLGEFDDDESDEKASVDILVEIGPHGALAGPIRQNLMRPELKDLGISYSTCLKRGESAVDTMHQLVCTLMGSGYRVDLGAVNFPNRNLPQVLTDLPPYPWNHQVKHWYESRTNKTLRERALPPHDLLGSLSLDSNSLAPTWRHIIRPSNIPWLRDHQIQSTIIYPGAGYLSMAIEGMRQVTLNTEKEVAGYELSNIDISRALVVPETSKGVEVQLSFQRCGDNILDSQGWQEFHIYSIDEAGGWNQHCEGLIRTVFEGSDSARRKSTTEKGQGHLGALPKSILPEDIYKSLRAVGINHGPIFQNIKSIRAGKGQSLCSFVVANTSATMPNEYEEKHVIHPTTLDSIFQAVYSALPGRQENGMIPKTIKSIFVSGNISNKAGHIFEAYSTLSQLSSQGFDTSIKVVDSLTPMSSPVLEVTRLHCQSLGSAMGSPSNPDDSKLCFSSVWKPDFATIKHSDFSDMFLQSSTSLDMQIIDDIYRAAALYIHKAINMLSFAELEALSSHQKRFYSWMKTQDANIDASLLLLSEEEKEDLLRTVESSSADGHIVCRVGQNLPAILQETISSKQLIAEGVVRNYFEGSLRIEHSYTQVAQIIELFSHKKPRARILEVCGGSGATTQIVLHALSSKEAKPNPRFGHYDFTDRFPNSLESARAEFKDFSDLISFGVLDIEESPASQNFRSESYDLVILSQGLLGVSDTHTAMSNVHGLLKPGGTVLILAHNLERPDIRLVFGGLSASIYSQTEGATYSPWEHLLQSTGFDGINIELHDSPDLQYRLMSVITSTLKRENVEYPSEIALVFAKSLPPQPWLEIFYQTFSTAVPCIIHIQLLAECDVADKMCIFFDEFEEPILHQLDDKQFRALKKLFGTSKGLLWISRGATAECPNPFAALHTGLLRTLRCENTARRYVSLDLDSQVELWTHVTAEGITNVFQESFDDSKDKNSIELEYSMRSNTTMISRVHENTQENAAVAIEDGEVEPELLPLAETGRDIRLAVGTPGLLDSLSFRDDESVTEPLPDDFVEIAPAAFGLNFRDVMVALGQLNERRMGWECSGVVTRIGKNSIAHGGYKVGDAVYACIRGHFATNVRVHHSSVHRMPIGMDFETAASIPLIFVTAYHALYNMANLKMGETVLIHSGTGGVGQAAIMLAQHIGAKIFVTVGSDEKRDFLVKKYGIPSEHIFSSRNRAFADNVMTLTGGNGVDVVLNSLAGQLLRETWNCIAYFGRFIEIGKRDLELNNNLEMGPFVRSVTYASIDLISLGELRGNILSSIMKDLTVLLNTKAIHAVEPLHIFSMTEAEKAFRTMTTGKHMGKIVLKPTPTDLVKVLPPTKQTVHLDPHSSYILVGGLGGIGQSISRMLIERGAQNLIIVSRSAASPSKDQEAFLRDLGSAGAKVVLRGCDVASKAQLTEVIEDCKRHMPPIKGVIQAAMVLRDCIFDDMSLEGYNTAVQPKVQGTWNLHELLAYADLDFFIMLSSISGFGGNASQANYAAGGTFQDALARYRASKNQPAVSIDLGMVKSVGVVSEMKKVADRLTRLGLRALEEDEVLRLVEAAILEPRRNIETSQVVTGIPSSFTPSTSDIFWNRDVRFSGLESVVGSRIQSKSSSQDASTDLKSQIFASTTLEEAAGFIARAMTKKLSDMFIIPESEIDLSVPLAKFGVDSLIAVELRNWILAHVQAECAVFDVMQSTSLVALAGKMASQSKLVAAAGLVQGG